MFCCLFRFLKPHSCPHTYQSDHRPLRHPPAGAATALCATLLPKQPPPCAPTSCQSSHRHVRHPPASAATALCATPLPVQPPPCAPPSCWCSHCHVRHPRAGAATAVRIHPRLVQNPQRKPPPHPLVRGRSLRQPPSEGAHRGTAPPRCQLQCCATPPWFSTAAQPYSVVNCTAAQPHPVLECSAAQPHVLDCSAAPPQA